MNTLNSSKTILCFGDSNTYGQSAEDGTRLAKDARWTGILQNMLGEGYEVIEEGLSSRTTDLDYPDRPYKNGRPYLTACLQSHNPLDFVCIMLGTNDLKTQFSRSAIDIRVSLSGLISDVRTHARRVNKDHPKIILISPILINGDAPMFSSRHSAHFDERSISESKSLSSELSDLAEAESILFVDAAVAAQPGADGIHIDSNHSEPLAALIASTIKSTDG